MIWAILVLLGVPLWLCAIGIGVLIRRASALKNRTGNFRLRWQTDSGRWARGNAIWVHDVIAYRSRPAAWSERLVWVESVGTRSPTEQELARLKRLGDTPMVISLRVSEGETQEIAVDREDLGHALGPFSASAAQGLPPQ